MEWTDETSARLRNLCAEGHSTAEIGRRMGITKNSVVGKAHRLNLDARPSPIRREGEEAPPRPAVARCLAGATLPPLVAEIADDAAESVPAREAPEEVFFVPPAAADPVPPPAPARPEAVKPPPIRALPPVRAPRTHTCCWPLGDPGTRSFRFCDAEAAQGKPYCGEHAALAYVKVRDRRDDAAA